MVEATVVPTLVPTFSGQIASSKNYSQSTIGTKLEVKTCATQAEVEVAIEVDIRNDEFVACEEDETVSGLSLRWTSPQKWNGQVDKTVAKEE